MVPNVRFTELLNDIEPSPTTNSNAATAHTNLRAFLKSHDTFKHRREHDFLAGSYARDTAIRPKKTEDGHERPDVDIIIVTNFKTSDAPDDVLGELAAALEDGEDGYDVERINKRSVRIVTANAEMDVVPVTAWGTTYQIPDRDLGHWMATNPGGHISWSRDQNLAFDGRFKPLVKLFKWWRRENRTGKRPKGFALEVLVAQHAPKTQLHYGEAFAQMLENIQSSYGALAAIGVKPTVGDPSQPGNNVLSKVSKTDWMNFMERARVHAEYARRAQKTEDMDEATRLWRKLFGERFKVTVNAAKAESRSSYATAPAAAASGYVFPATSAAPVTPRGFA